VTTANKQPQSVLCHLGWIGGACVIGFLVSFISTDLAALPRNWFVLVHLLVNGTFVLAYARSVAFGWRDWSSRWQIGVTVGLVAAAISIAFVLSRPPSSSPGGLQSAIAVVWLGVVYGAVDAILLTVLPANSIVSIARARGWLTQWWGVPASAVVALGASVAVTVSYHAGFPEFQGPRIVDPVIGNTIFTLSYLATLSPIAPVLSHSAMHIAAAIHAYQTSIPLPPHY
jgi:hypothetical protein